MTRVLIVLASLFNVAICFCGNHALHGNLAESAIQVSNWLREHYHDDVTRLEPHVTSAMISSLRLAGHLPHTILSDLKMNGSHTVSDDLKSYLDSHQMKSKTLSEIPPGQIANIFQAVVALCYDPQNFHGHNLTKELLESFKLLRFSTRVNHFEYSLVALAVCQSFEREIQPDLAKEISLELNKRLGKVTRSRQKLPDGQAMGVIALSCLQRNTLDRELLKDINRTISEYLYNVVDALAKHKDRLWNAQSKGLVVQAFMSLPKALRSRHWHCNRLVSSILNKHDPRKAFGNVLANIQILPVLLGRSLVHLKNIPCGTQANSQIEVNKSKTVCIKLIFQDDQSSPPDELTFVVPAKTTAYEILRLAAQKNDAYKFETLNTSYGRMITAIANVKQNKETGHYWAVYASERSLAPDGVDIFIPKNNTCVIFKYERCSSLEDKMQN